VEQRDAIDAAARHGCVFLEPPSQTVEEIQLAFAKIIILVVSGLRVIAGLLQVGVLQADGGGMSAQIAGIKVDDLGQQTVAPLFHRKDKHFTNDARLAEGENRYLML
jgi:hypothetical protein